MTSKKRRQYWTRSTSAAELDRVQTCDIRAHRAASSTSWLLYCSTFTKSNITSSLCFGSRAESRSQDSSKYPISFYFSTGVLVEERRPLIEGSGCYHLKGNDLKSRIGQCYQRFEFGTEVIWVGLYQPKKLCMWRTSAESGVHTIPRGDKPSLSVPRWGYCPTVIARMILNPMRLASSDWLGWTKSLTDGE